jgi:hypothetical protein
VSKDSRGILLKAIENFLKKSFSNFKKIIYQISKKNLSRISKKILLKTGKKHFKSPNAGCQVRPVIQTRHFSGLHFLSGHRTYETGAMGHEIESRQIIGWRVKKIAIERNSS